jgi:hypothetical protein
MEIEKMNLQKNKSFASIALILLLTVSAIMIALPVANAHTPPLTLSTYAYLTVSPNPAGVGQTVFVDFWLDKVPPGAEGNYGAHWHNMMVTVTKPDGTNQNLGPFDSDAVGGAHTAFTPSAVGSYTFVFNFPGQVIKLENPPPYPVSPIVPLGYDFVNDTYSASSSKPVTLVVQQQQIATSFPATPLPTDYWQRPISSMNRDWYSISGNWLGLGPTAFGATGTYNQNGNFNPYTTAPNSAHVVWTKPEAFGGQIGGEFGPDETSLYATGTAYETKFGAVILNGILYYTAYPGASNNPGPLTAVDLRTGKTLWTVNADDGLKVGMIYNFKTGNQYGGHAYLFTETSPFPGFIVKPVPTKWQMFDAMTGQWILNIANASSGTLVEGPNGEILSYLVANGMLSLWNSSKCIAAGGALNNIYAAYSSTEVWRPPQGATIDWNAGIQWSVPVATSISGAPIAPPLGIAPDPSGSTFAGKISDGVVLMTAAYGFLNGGPPGGAQTGWRIDAGYSASTGQLLWGPINRTLTPYTNVDIGATGEGIYTEYTQQTMKWSAYNITTGQKLWGPVGAAGSSWDYYDFADSAIAYGNLYTWGFGGTVNSYNLQTGTFEWSWTAPNAGIDSPFGVWPLGTFPNHYILADGKLYVSAGHDYTPPVFKGAKLYCLNATSGGLIWSSLNFNIEGGPAIADGYMLWYNGYDNQIYAYGKGQSATTVSAPDTAILLGTPVLIKGTETDQSPGQTSIGIPAAGTPAISDASMSQWMEYLYQQQLKPTNATGVPVTLTAIDPNGNTQNIGTATSNALGNYAIAWTPPVPGLYTVTATFAGSNSYFSSQAGTAFEVSKAAAASVPTTSPSASPATSPGTTVTSNVVYLVAAAVAIIIVIIALAALLLRRRTK